jgi:hypothetical protein
VPGGIEAELQRTLAVIGHLEPGRLLVLSDPRQSPAQASSCAIVDIETSEIARSPVQNPAALSSAN